MHVQKEMWHFAVCTVTPQLGDVKTSRRVSAIGGHLCKRVWRCFECQRSRRSSLEQETDKLRKKNEGTKRCKKRQNTTRHYKTHNHINHQISAEPRTLRSMVGAHGNVIRPWAWSCFQSSHSHGSFSPHVVLRARWVWLGLPAKLRKSGK